MPNNKTARVYQAASDALFKAASLPPEEKMLLSYATPQIARGMRAQLYSTRKALRGGSEEIGLIKIDISPDSPTTITLSRKVKAEITYRVQDKEGNLGPVIELDPVLREGSIRRLLEAGQSREELTEALSPLSKAEEAFLDELFA